MKQVLYFALGVAAGAAVTFLSVKKHYEHLAFNEISEIKETYRKKVASKELADKNNEEKKKLLSNETGKTGVTGTDETEKKAHEAIKRYSGNFNVFTNPPDPTEIDNGVDDEEDISPDPYEFIVDRSGPGEENQDPYVITEEEFASEKLFYDKVLIEYYEDGIAVLEDTDEIIDSLEDLIGPYILGKPVEDDTIYVRNNRRSTDYGIIFKDTEFVSEEGLS